jgi:hypothetical protein
MLGIIRTSSRSAVHHLDRQRTFNGYFVRSTRMCEGLSAVGPFTVRSYFHNGYEVFACERFFEGAICVSNSDSDQQNGNQIRRTRDISIHHHSFLQREFPSSELFPPAPSLLAKSSSLVVGRSASVWFRSRHDDPFAQRSSLGTLVYAPRGYPGGHKISTNSGPMVSRRQFSTESNGSRSQYKTSVKIPEPKSAPSSSMYSLASFNPKTVLLKLYETTWSITKTVLTFMAKLPGNIFFYITHPQERRDKIQEIKGHAKKELDHYWTGSKVRIGVDFLNLKTPVIRI